MYYSSGKDIAAYTEDGEMTRQAIADNLFRVSLAYDAAYGAMLLAAPQNIIDTASSITKSVGFNLHEGHLPAIKLQRPTKQKDSDLGLNFTEAYVQFKLVTQENIDL